MKGIYLITGVMASGKSTVGEALAGKLEKGVHLRGDIFQRMIVSGREEMSPNPSPEALRQLYMRYELTANAGKTYHDNGFSVVIQDNYYGDELTAMVDMFKGYPLFVTVLCPPAEIVKVRESFRDKKGYGAFTVDELYEGFMEKTPRIGFWLDNSDQTPDETAENILRYFGV